MAAFHGHWHEDRVRCLLLMCIGRDAGLCLSLCRQPSPAISVAEVQSKGPHAACLLRRRGACTAEFLTRDAYCCGAEEKAGGAQQSAKPAAVACNRSSRVLPTKRVLPAGGVEVSQPAPQGTGRAGMSAIPASISCAKTHSGRRPHVGLLYQIMSTNKCQPHVMATAPAPGHTLCQVHVMRCQSTRLVDQWNNTHQVQGCRLRYSCSKYVHARSCR